MNLVGMIIGNRYEILEIAGFGGMSTVYKAKCHLLSRFVAIKILKEKYQFDEEFVKRFKIESQASAMLSHPNIVSIYDYGHENGLYYIVLEYVKGSTLKNIIENSTLTWRQSVSIIIQVVKALDYAHKKSIIHRDIKPQNILITNENVAKITDFGIAHASVNHSSTVEINTLGSVIYFSPEQARGSYTDEKSDIYSIGVVLYEMVTSKVPFDGDSSVSIAIKHLEGRPTPPSEYNLLIPESLENVILKAMKKEQYKRYQSASELLYDLECVIRGEDCEKSLQNFSETAKVPILLAKNKELYKEAKRKSKYIKEEEGEEIDEKKYKKKKRIGVTLGILASLAVVGFLAFKLLPLFGINYFNQTFSKNEVEIPELIGKNIADVSEKYRGTNFKIVRTGNVDSEEEPGTIISQYPEVGKKVKSTVETELNVKLSSGKKEVILSNYAKYRDYREAQVELENLGLKVKIIKENSDKIPINSITKQFPASDSRVAKGAEILLYVSIGPLESKPQEIEKEKPAPKPKEDSSVNEEVKEQASENIEDEAKVKAKDLPNSSKQKSALVTITVPKEKDTLVIIKAGSKIIYEKTRQAGDKFDLKISSEKEEIKLDIYFDNVFMEQKNVELK